MLRVADLHCAYGRREVLREVDLAFGPGELVALLGINGSGKSTLLRHLNGIMKARRGAVLVRGRDLAAMSGREAARQIAYLPQKNNAAACTVFEAVLLGRTPHLRWEVSARDLEVAGETITRLDLGPHAHRPVAELSGGEFQKVLIARALAQEPDILLLDEPINHLDIRNQLDTMAALARITRELGILVVVVLHDLSLALRFADRFVLLKDGRVFAAGGPEVINRETIRAVYRIEAEVHQVAGVPVVVAR
jgi:iron complex transport system ATP-binding protein